MASRSSKQNSDNENYFFHAENNYSRHQIKIFGSLQPIILYLIGSNMIPLELFYRRPYAIPYLVSVRLQQNEVKCDSFAVAVMYGVKNIDYIANPAL